jgi:hypothetical protein
LICPEDFPGTAQYWMFSANRITAPHLKWRGEKTKKNGVNKISIEFQVIPSWHYLNPQLVAFST